MPGIVDDLPRAEPALVLSHDYAVLLDDDAVGVGLHVHGPPHGLGHYRVLVGVEPDEAGLGHRHRRVVEAVERTAIGDQRRPLGLEHLEDGLSLISGCGCDLA